MDSSSFDAAGRGRASGKIIPVLKAFRPMHGLDGFPSELLNSRSRSFIMSSGSMFARILSGTFARCCAAFDDTRKLESQISWLMRSLRQSNALWKVIAADMPLSVVVPDGTDSQCRPKFENSGNGNGPGLGRELKIADLLSDIDRNRIHNTVCSTLRTN